MVALGTIRYLKREAAVRSHPWKVPNMVPTYKTGRSSVVAIEFERLAKAIVAARQAKGWLQDDLIRESGLGRSTIQRLEKGRQKTPPNRATVQSLERALTWLPGSVEAVLAGGVPAVGTFDGRFLRVQIDDKNSFIHDLVRRITIEIDPDAPQSRVIAAEAVAEEALRAARLLPPLGDDQPGEMGSAG